MCFTHGTRLDTETKQACAVIAPELLLTTDVDINAYHRSTAHTRHYLLLRSAEQQDLNLKKGSKLSRVWGVRGHRDTSQQPVAGGETGVATVEGRVGTSRPGGGGKDAFKDDDDGLDVTWADSNGTAEVIAAAAGETPKDERVVQGIVRGRRE